MRKLIKTGETLPSRLPQRLGASVYWFLVASVWACIGLLALIIIYGHDLPASASITKASASPLITVLAADGSELTVLGSQSDVVPVDELPATLIHAVLAVEDRRFYSHWGIDVLGIARASLVNIFAGRIKQGGSTITQQLAKALFLTPKRTLNRKVKEFLLALWLEERLSKNDILSLYLNRVYFGAGSWGVEAASRRYFRKSSRDLNLYESAILAGLLKAPSRYAPTVNPSGAAKRAAVVLRSMVNAGYLKPREASAVESDSVVIKPSVANLGNRYFADWVVDQIPDYVGNIGRNLTVRTTLEPFLQTVAENVISKSLETDGIRQKVKQAALISMSPDGAVRAMVGGKSYRESSFNRAVKAQRQPGSAFKFFVYLAALESGLTPDDIFHDKPITISGWSPQNYSGSYIGPITLRDAFSLSINTIAVQLSEQVGRDKVIDMAQRLGITTPLPNHPSLALGSIETRLIELTGAYATARNAGKAVLPYAIIEIQDSVGTQIYSRIGDGPGVALTQITVQHIVDMLITATSTGTGQAANLDRPTGGKTGTSQDFRDAWFIGFTSDLVTGVWFGNDNASPMDKVTGGGLPARTWRKFMEEAHKDKPQRPLLPKVTATTRTVDPDPSTALYSGR